MTKETWDYTPKSNEEILLEFYDGNIKKLKDLLEKTDEKNKRDVIRYHIASWTFLLNKNKSAFIES